MIDRLLDAAILWLSAIGTVFCAYKSLIAIDVYYNRSEMYSSPFGLVGALAVFLAGTALCATLGLWCEIHRLRMDRKEAKRSATATRSRAAEMSAPSANVKLNVASTSATSPQPIS